MKIIKLIADSGGTKTDWYGMNSNKETIQLRTESYHPMHINAAFLNKCTSFWKNYDLSSCSLNFYGAGCLQAENQSKMLDFLTAIGFKNCTVESDLYAAIKIIDEEKCNIAICGTGSVFVRAEYDQIIELRGGLGWKDGDEGSGFYFGKLLIETLQTDIDKHQAIKEIIEQHYSLEYLLSIYNEPASKYTYANLANILANSVTDPTIMGLHIKNIQLFIDKYLKDVDSLYLVGGYAFHFKEYFEFVFNQNSIEIIDFIDKPIHQLFNRFVTI
ncbi:MAG TPA: hypothetical protein VKZ44_05005 [Taishania sp.]|nr:hypothetical protein [Taishania sp.]